MESENSELCHLFVSLYWALVSTSEKLESSSYSNQD